MPTAPGCDAPAPWEPRWLRRLGEDVPAAPASAPGRAVARLWAAPVSALGLLLGLAGRTRPRVAHGVWLFAPVRGPAARFLTLGRYSAIALGHTILARSADPPAVLIAHELAHVRQAERYGPFFVPLYLGLLAVSGYRRHPLERAARRAGRAAAAC
jgi:hypothetical protein